MRILRADREADVQRLFGYWIGVGREIPYFFTVSRRRWRTCLLESEREGQPLFRSLETCLAAEKGRVLGFVQWGEPAVAWDEGGQKRYNPRMGVIRHLYFDRGRPDVGAALLSNAAEFMAGFRRNHAFYHSLGMSCNAYHGKLHSSQSHVGRLLRSEGYEVEHENAYYVLDMTRAAPSEDARVHVCRAQLSDDERFVMRVNDRAVGSAHVRYLDRLTGGSTRDAAYLASMRVDEPHRGRGIGTEGLNVLIQRLSCEGYRHLHTDTANGNLHARRFYEKLGFRQAGCTRSYVRLAE